MTSFIRHIKEKSPNTFGFFSFLSRACLWVIGVQWGGRAIFLLQRGLWQKLTFSDLAGSYFFGFPLDLAFTAYLMIPFTVLALSAVFVNSEWLRRTILVLGFIVLVFTVLINAADAEMYSSWGSRFNRQAIQYLQMPEEAMASSSEAAWGTMLALLLLFGGWFAYRLHRLAMHFKYAFDPVQKTGKIYTSLAGLLLLAAWGLAARGGAGTVPINQSVAVFSSNTAANLAAVNGPWNFLYYVINKSEPLDPEKYRQFESGLEYADKRLLYYDTAVTAMFAAERPNICLVLLESFSAYTSSLLGGKYDCTPFLDSLSGDGLLFTQAYAQGDRTDKGLACVLGGWPGQPWQSILHEPDKAARLPSLARELSGIGYQSSFLYGGDLGFANMKSYLAVAGVNQLLDESSFDGSLKTSKWGAHDEFVFERLLKVNDDLKAPWLSMVLTLSSHEPFDVPGPKRYQGGGDQARFLNSIMYADASLRAFIRQAAQKAWFRNTVFVFVADHGRDLGLPETPFDRPGHFHIPLLFWGPALRPELRGRKISRVVAQTDMAQTLLQHISGNKKRVFSYGRNLLSDRHPGMTSYHFNNGFGVISGQDWVVYHNDGRNHFGSRKEDRKYDSLLNAGKALQYRLVKQYRSF